MNRSRDDPAARYRAVQPVCECVPSRSPRVISFLSVLAVACLLRQHLLDLLIAQVNLVDGIAALLEWHIVVVAVRGDEDLGVPDEALRRGEIGDLVIQTVSDAAKSLTGGGTA